MTTPLTANVGIAAASAVRTQQPQVTPMTQGAQNPNLSQSELAKISQVRSAETATKKTKRERDNTAQIPARVEQAPSSKRNRRVPNRQQPEEAETKQARVKTDLVDIEA